MRIEDSLQLAAGSFNAPHNGRNLGKAPVKLVVFYTGVEGTPNTVKVQHK